MAKEKVLFLCSGNSARSQMGEGLLRKHAGDRFDVFSAGLDPHPVHPFTLRVLAEAGIDTARHCSKGLDTFLGKEHFQYVIIVCDEANKKCPAMFPGMGERLFWPFDDPVALKGTEEEQLAGFRRIRDQIDAKIKEWLKPEEESEQTEVSGESRESESTELPKAAPPEPEGGTKLKFTDLEP